MSKWTFSVPEGYFDDCAPIAAQLPRRKLVTQPLFALTPREYPSDASTTDTRPWARFTEHVRALNRDAPANVAYKIMFFTRHGQGYHNLKSEKVGEEAWANHFSYIDGDKESTWFDAFLTPLGIAQATALSEHWLASIASDGLPVPQALYTSPLARCLQTSLHFIKPVMDAHARPYHPIVKENLRERWTRHTCDQRRPRAWIAEHWPMCVIEDGFREDDLLGTQPEEETAAEHETRNLEALADVFEQGKGVEVVSWTFHSLAMQALLGCLKVPQFKVQPATTIALLVRGENEQ